MAADLFEHKPERCPFGHQLGPGRVLIGWTPCVCGPAREADQRGRGLGHAWVVCRACEDEGRNTVYSEPDCAGPRQAGGWQ